MHSLPNNALVKHTNSTSLFHQLIRQTYVLSIVCSDSLTYKPGCYDSDQVFTSIHVYNRYLVGGSPV